MEPPIVSPRPVFSRTRSSPSVPGSPKTPTRSSPSTSALLALPLPVLIFDSALLLHSANHVARRAFGIVKFSGLAPDITEFVCPDTNEHHEPSTSTQGPLMPVEAIRRDLVRRAQLSASGESGWGSDNASPITLRSFDSGSEWTADAIVTEFWPERPSRPNFASQLSATSVGSSDKASSRGSNTPNAERDSFFPPTAATGPWFSLMLTKRRNAASSRPQQHFALPQLPVSPTRPLKAASFDAQEAERRRSSGGAASNPRPLRLSDLPSPATPPLSSTGTVSSKGSSLLSRHMPSSSSSAESSIPSADSAPSEEDKPSIGISVSSAGIQLSTSIPQPPDVAMVDVPATHSRSHSSDLEAENDMRAPHMSKRPTSLPPIPAKEPAVPAETELFQLASLRSLPRTGVIIADSGIQKGYVNALARELLMGVPVSTSQQAAWWEEGLWYANDGLSAFESSSGSHTASGSQTTASSSFFPHSPRSDQSNPFERGSITQKSIIRSGEGTRVGNKINISKPMTNTVHMTVANILLRSLLSTVGALKPAEVVTEDVEMTDEAPRQPDKAAWKEAKANFLPAGATPGKKPYKVYDSSFSQRIIDPLEPLLEMCARYGKTPEMYIGEESSDSGAFSGMVIGLEVEVVANEDGFDQKKMGKRNRVRRRLVQIDGAPLMVDGQHWGGIITLRDVTDERRVETQRADTRPTKHSDGHYKLILDQMPQMVWTTTPLGSHDFFNVQWYDYTGLEPEESLGVGWQNPFHEDDMALVVPLWKHSLETGDPYSVEYRCRRYDGAWRWMLGRALPYRDATGEIKGWFGTCTDVDDFVRMRASLAKTQEQMTAILKGASILIWVVDRNFEFTFFEGKGKHHIKRELNRGRSLEGSHLRDVWRDSPPYEAVEKIFAGELQSAEATWRIQDANGDKIWVLQCSLTPFKETQSDGVVVISGVIFVATDITELTNAQERLEASLEERSRLRASEIAAKEASRLKSDYLMATSHEIRTPIAGMIGMAELLLEDPNLTEGNRVAIGKILRSGEILLEMVGMVLDMGKVEAGKLDLENRPFMLEEVITDARIFSIAANKKGLRFIEDVAPLYSKHVMGDMPRLRQVISNLLSNAIKFTAKGSVTLRARQEEEGSRVYVTFQVIDTGIGIRKEAISSLFKPFQQAEASTSRLYGGTGLGLAICKNLVDLMGGTISLESAYMQGTTMTARVPFEKAPEGSLSSLSSPENIAGSDILRESIRILVADDNDLIREILTKTLSKMRFQVRSATNGAEVLQAVEREHIDLIIMDQQMPVMSGFEATRRLRQSPHARLQRVKIIALTASAVQGDEEKCLEAGMNAYLTKPVRAAALETAILNQLATIPLSQRGSPSWRKRAEQLHQEQQQSQSQQSGQTTAAIESERIEGPMSPPPFKRSRTAERVPVSSTIAVASAAVAHRPSSTGSPATTPGSVESERQLSSSSSLGADMHDTTEATMALAEAPELVSRSVSSSSTTQQGSNTPRPSSSATNDQQQEPSGERQAGDASPVRLQALRRPSYPAYSSDNNV